LPPVRDYLCEWDVSTNQRVNQFVANSRTVAARIKKFYGRESKVLYPPVDVDFFTPAESDRGTFFLIVSALVPYKRIEVAIEAFNRNGKPLVIVGTGPEYKRLKKISESNIQYLGRIDAAELRELYRKTAALIQPAEEDFGINIIEALACRCPVIALSRDAIIVLTVAVINLTLGRRVFFHFCGCDIRDSKHVIATYDYSACKTCWPQLCSPNRPRALDIARRFADGVFVSTPDLLEFMPGSTLLPQPIELGRVDLLRGAGLGPPPGAPGGLSPPPPRAGRP